jgi:transcription termination factor NusB
MTAMNKSLLKKRAARLAAVQALYAGSIGLENKSAKDLASTIKAQWKDSKINEDQDWPSDIAPDNTLLERILVQTVDSRSFIDSAIEKLILPGWKKERMSPLMLCIFVACGAERLDDQKKPRAMLIGEYTDVASGFLSEDELAYMHKALNLLLDELDA